MSGWVFNRVLAAFLIVPVATALAGEPVETLPAPREEAPASTPLGSAPAYPAYQRANPYAVWQLYGVDREGFFRPRVIYSPSGPYYLYNGEPYLFAPMHNRDFMPYIVD